MRKEKEKNSAAVALGRLGGKARAKRLSKKKLSEIGKRGAEARAEKLSPRRRQEIARHAALVRSEKRRQEKEAAEANQPQSEPTPA